MNKQRRFGARDSWAVLILYIALIFFLSTRSGRQTRLPFEHLDKVVHLVEYGILGYLSQRAARLSWPRGIGRRHWLRFGLVLACGVGIAVADELVQSFTPDRVPSVWDFAADLLGLTIGLALMTRGSTGAPLPGGGGRA